MAVSPPAGKNEAGIDDTFLSASVNNDTFADRVKNTAAAVATEEAKMVDAGEMKNEAAESGLASMLNS